MQMFDGAMCHNENAAKQAFLADASRRTARVLGVGAAQDWLIRLARRSGLEACIGPDEGAIGAEWCDLGVIDLRGAEGAAWLRRSQAQLFALTTNCARLCILVDLDSLDEAVALIDDPEANFLCNPSDSELISEFVMAGLGLRVTRSAGVHDITRDQEAMRLERLSEEVRRLASTIEQLTIPNDPFSGSDASSPARHGAFRGKPVDSTGSAVQPIARPWESHGNIATERAAPNHADIRNLIRARRMRDEFLSGDLFADPAWDMLLDLLAARLAGQRVSVSSLCIAAAVPPTTALRWIRQLTDREIFERIADPLDGRRVFIALTDSAATSLLDWVEAVRRRGGLLAEAAR